MLTVLEWPCTPVTLLQGMMHFGSLASVCGRLHAEKQALEAQRLSKFCSVMKAVNANLGVIYQKLTAGQGDAYLSYTTNALLLFAEGVQFHVRSLLWAKPSQLLSLVSELLVQAGFQNPVLVPKHGITVDFCVLSIKAACMVVKAAIHSL